MNKSAAKDMTYGNPLKLILAYAIPVFLSSLFQQIYTVADTAIVSKTLGDQALAAVGSIGSVNFLILGFCNGMGMGFAIPIAQKFGAKDIEGVKKYAGNAVWVFAVVSAIVTTIAIGLCGTILQVTKTPVEIMDMAYQYLLVIFLGIPVQFAYNALAGIIRSLGDSKTPLYILVVASIVNIVLDLVFILGFSLGTIGAAMATVFSQFFSVIGCIVLIVKKIPELRLAKTDLIPQRLFLLDLIKYGLPMGLQMSVTGIGSILLQTSVNSLGTIAVASVVAAERICNTVSVVTTSIASAMSVYCGQNLGAKQYGRINHGVKTGVVLGFGFSTVACIILLFFGRTFTLLFLNATSTELIEMTYQYIRIVAMFLWAQSLIFSVRFSIQGLGHAYIALVACLLEMAARSIFGLYVVPSFGFVAAALSSPAAWVVADALLVPAMMIIIKKMSKLEMIEEGKHHLPENDQSATHEG